MTGSLIELEQPLSGDGGCSALALCPLCVLLFDGYPIMIPAIVITTITGLRSLSREIVKLPGSLAYNCAGIACFTIGY